MASILRLFVLSSMAILASACAGEPAPDPILCRDTIDRLCPASPCASVNSLLPPGANCRATLLQRTGCGADAFAFTAPTRERFLECREPLVRRSAAVGATATCAEVEEAFGNCPDFVEFLGGGQQ